MPILIGNEPVITIRATDPYSLHIIGCLYLVYSLTKDEDKMKEMEVKEKAFKEYLNAKKEPPELVD